MKSTKIIAIILAVLMSFATLCTLIIPNGTASFGLLIFVLLFGLIPAMVASNKGRDFFTWWMYGWAFWLIAMIHSLCIKDETGPMFVHVTPQGPSGAPAGYWPAPALPAPILAPIPAAPRLSEVEAVLREWKRCPHCAEVIRTEARVCHHCRRDLES